MRPLILTLGVCWQRQDDIAQMASLAWSLKFSRARKSCGGRAMTAQDFGHNFIQNEHYVWQKPQIIITGPAIPYPLMNYSYSSHPPISLSHLLFLSSFLSASVKQAHSVIPPTLSTNSSSHFSSLSNSFLVFFLGGGGGNGGGGVRLFGCRGAMRDSTERDDLR